MEFYILRALHCFIQSKEAILLKEFCSHSVFAPFNVMRHRVQSAVLFQFVGKEISSLVLRFESFRLDDTLVLLHTGNRKVFDVKLYN